MKKKFLIIASALILVIGFTVGGTLAWLKATTPSIENTFTYGKIEIELKESDNLDLKMIPGNTITKDPKITVKAGSESCWLFVKIDESNNLRSVLDYSVATGWELVPGTDNVYYREVSSPTDDQAFSVLAGDQVSVPYTVTKEDFAAVTEVKLTFTAYAVQRAGVENVSAAWDIAK